MKLLEFHGFNLSGQMAQILFKDEKRRLRMEKELGTEIPKGSELYSILNEEDETFNIKKYINE